jgi:hypothetical protein
MRQLHKEFEKKNLHEITAWEIEKYKPKRIEERAATVNREQALLKHMFTKAIEWSKVKESPAKKVKPQNPPQEEAVQKVVSLRP